MMFLGVDTTKYDITFVEKQVGADVYLVKPKYMPKQWTPKENSFSEQMQETWNDSKNDTQTDSNTISALTEEQKKILLDKFQGGQGKLSMEEWDDFLLQMVDFGLITNHERLEAIGFVRPVATHSNGTLGDPYTVAVTEAMEDPLSMWQDDPKDWLEKMDFYFYKQILYAKRNQYTTSSIEQTREHLQKIAKMLEELLEKA